LRGELSLRNAAKPMGITLSHLRLLEEGYQINPTVEVLAGISRSYGVDLGELAKLAGEPFMDPNTPPSVKKRFKTWRLIDDAPRDGTQILGRRVWADKYTGKLHYEKHATVWRDGAWRWGSVRSVWYPTQWTPEPPLPTHCKQRRAL
jgi:transcriptional regulator with XRE-family HTH domain